MFSTSSASVVTDPATLTTTLPLPVLYEAPLTSWSATLFARSTGMANPRPIEPALDAQLAGTGQVHAVEPPGDTERLAELSRPRAQIGVVVCSLTSCVHL